MKCMLRGHNSSFTPAGEALCVEGKSQTVLGSSFFPHLANFVRRLGKAWEGFSPPRSLRISTHIKVLYED